MFLAYATSTDARELLVLKLLEERKKNAARLQAQLLQHSTHILSKNGNSLDETNTETEISFEAESEFDRSRNEEFENSQDLENSQGLETENGSDEKLFRSSGVRKPRITRSIFFIHFSFSGLFLV